MMRIAAVGVLAVLASGCDSKVADAGDQSVPGASDKAGAAPEPWPRTPKLTLAGAAASEQEKEAFQLAGEAIWQQCIDKHPVWRASRNVTLTMSQLMEPVDDVYFHKIRVAAAFDAGGKAEFKVTVMNGSANQFGAMTLRDAEFCGLTGTQTEMMR